jgi:hypothetical protein
VSGTGRGFGSALLQKHKRYAQCRETDRQKDDYMIKQIGLWTLIINVQLLFAQTSPNEFMTKEAAHQDISILKTSIFEIHPSTFRYTSKREFNDEFSRATNKVTDSIKIIEFANLIVPIISKIHCGHTFPLISYINATTKAIPFDVKVINDRLFVLGNYSLQNEPKPGSELIEINGITTTNLLNNLRDKEIGDGFVVTTKDRKIERFFKWYFAMYFNQPDSFRIKFKLGENSEIRVATLASLKDSEIEKNRGVQDKLKPLDFRIDKANDLAVLRIGSFMANQVKKKHKQNFKKIVKSAFTEIEKKKIGNLVIDIRDNTGGMAFAPPFLYSYLGTKDFKFKSKLLFRHGYRFSNPKCLNRSKTNDWFNRKLMKRINDTTYEWTLHNNTRKLYSIKKNVFKGQLFVLQNGMTASGAAEFATLVHHNHRGTIVGEESGGDYNGINGYDRTYLRLPNSKIGVLIAGYKSIMPWDEKQYFGHGVPVDYEVHSQITDLVNGQDAELDFVYKLIKK